MTYEDIGENQPSEFGSELENTYLGKYIIIGVTYFDSSGNEIEKIQKHGIICAITSEGIEIQLEGIHKGESWIIPPAFDFINPAQPGIYSLHSTGETVEDPDFISTWNVTRSGS